MKSLPTCYVLSKLRFFFVIFACVISLLGFFPLVTLQATTLDSSYDNNNNTPELLYQFHGTHFVASYKGCSAKAIHDIDGLRYALLMAAHESGAKVLSHQDFTFSGSGFTMVVLLSESHASIHTYPEHNACFVDLFTCGTNCSWEKFDTALTRYLCPQTVNSSIIERN